MGNGGRLANALRIKHQIFAAFDETITVMVQGPFNHTPQVIPAEQQRPRLGSVIFELIRGLAIGQSLMEALPHGTPRRADDEARHALVQALAAYLNR